ncbi:hypothetical protein QAD02_022210 [Eretmocerus hayati]|uniref:Uncharacterized protein n=1 Tax=Eretmocerus hayati TaxID=131215 RepID=A0ACC2PTY9_9HYME|nr:hypothetical protein QAD02_022210 [Eretmocerus hayati]
MGTNIPWSLDKSAPRPEHGYFSHWAHWSAAQSEIMPRSVRAADLSRFQDRFVPVFTEQRTIPETFQGKLLPTWARMVTNDQVMINDQVQWTSQIVTRWGCSDFLQITRYR